MHVASPESWATVGELAVMDHLASMRILTRVVELGSFSRAACDMQISQSTATKHIVWLETHLGARLLNRNTRGISLTEEGSVYYERCKTVLKEVDDAAIHIRTRNQALSGTLRLSTSIAFGRNVISPMLIEFMREHPDLKVDMTCEDAYIDIVARGFDAAVRLGRLVDSSLGGRYIGSNPWVMIAGTGYLDGRNRPRSPNELLKHNCLVYSSVQGDAVWQLSRQGSETCSTVVHGSLRSNNLSTLLSAVQSNLGIAIVPRYLASPALKSGKVVPILEDYALPEQEIHAVLPSPKFVPQRVAALINFLIPRFKGPWWK